MDMIKQIKMDIIKRCYNNSKCKNPQIEIIISRSEKDCADKSNVRSECWLIFITSLLKFVLKDDNTIETWIKIRDSFLIVSDDPKIEGYKKSIYGYMRITMKNRLYKQRFVGKDIELCDIYKIEEEDTNQLEFIKELLLETLTEGQQLLIRHLTEDIECNMSERAKKLMLKRVKL